MYQPYRVQKSKENARKFKRYNRTSEYRVIKIINFEIKKLKSWALKHPLGFPHNMDGVKYYFDQLQRDFARSKEIRLKNC
jgi:hypothetical protein